MRRRQAVLLLLLPLLLATGSPARPVARAQAPAAAQVCASLRLSEFLPRPESVDWDGDGAVSALDEWIELYNPEGVACDLGGWTLDDSAGTGSTPYTLPSGSEIAPYGYAVLYRRQTGIALHNDAGAVRLLDPAGREAEIFRYGLALPDRSWSVEPGGLNWVITYPPTPGEANGPARYDVYLPLVLAGQ